MRIKNSIPAGIIVSLVLLFVATRYYPGGSQYDKNSIGYDWGNNYLSNLFSLKAVNGAENTSRPWAVAGMLFLCVSIALFFIDFSSKIPPKGPARIIRYCGSGAMVFTFLAVTPYHDIMVTISVTLALVSIFYITVFLFKTRFLFFKIFSVAYMLVFYTCTYIYYTRNYLEFLPILQKVVLAITIVWILSLQYFTARSDFETGAGS